MPERGHEHGARGEPHRCRRPCKIGHDAFEPLEQLIEGHTWLHQIRGLLAQHVHEAFGIEVEEVRNSSGD
jgi:hypothetical protein